MKRNKLMLCMCISLIMGTELLSNTRLITTYAKTEDRKYYGTNDIYNTDKEFFLARELVESEQQIATEAVTVPVYFSSPPVLDSSWTVIDETTTSGIYLNGKIQSLIGLGNRKFYIKNGVYHLNDSIPINEPGVIIQGESRDHTMLIQDSPGANSVEITEDNVEISEINLDGTIGRRVFNCKM